MIIYKVEKEMKLLIVDDEDLTRSGVISSIDWKALGINEVLQANDGMNGLEMARIHRPEIILCDVRMPRMDGIAMLERLETILPDTVSIFMSGYSDKEYLKAAIKLKAISYIEKPLNLKEIQEAVLEARELFLRRQRSHRGETLHSLETASRLALCLTTPYGANSQTIDQLAKELSLKFTSETFFTAVIVKLGLSLETKDPSREEIFTNLETFLKSYHMNCIYVEKHLQYLVYLIFGSSRPSTSQLHDMGRFLGQQYSQFNKYMIVAGEPQQGVWRAYQSYASAVILIQSSFFFPANSFLVPSNLSENRPGSSGIPSSLDAAFTEALFAKDKLSCKNLLKQLSLFFTCNSSFLQNQVKDYYYRLFLSLVEARKQLMVTAAPSLEDSIAEAMEKCFNFQELHQTLEEKTSQFFTDLENSVEENHTIFLIKEYISHNYMDATLSVKDIGTYVHLSASYVCTFFKNETGQTLNQYLTEYRMERAKQLLVDMRYKISEISSKVGYSDGNYFGKSFKKYCGLSPSEYREKMIE